MDIFVMRPFNAHTFFKGIDDIFYDCQSCIQLLKFIFLRNTVLFANF